MHPPDERNGRPRQEAPASKDIDPYADESQCASPPVLAPPVGLQKRAPSPVRFARAVLEQAAVDELMPWIDWLHLAWTHLGRTPTVPDEPIAAWRSLRRRTLAVLDELGAEACVIRTDDDVPLDEHLADLAGLVRVAVPGVWPASSPRPATPAEAWLRDQLGLAPALFPATLRGLVGQMSIADDARDPLSRTSLLLAEGAWRGPRTWLDAAGCPVLTFSAAAATPAELAALLEVMSAGLPVRSDVAPASNTSPSECLVCVVGDASRPPARATWTPAHEDVSLRELAERLSLPALVDPFDPAPVERM